MGQKILTYLAVEKRDNVLPWLYMIILCPLNLKKDQTLTIVASTVPLAQTLAVHPTHDAYLHTEGPLFVTHMERKPSFRISIGQ